MMGAIERRFVSPARKNADRRADALYDFAADTDATRSQTALATRRGEIP
jgi:hypothetical protein